MDGRCESDDHALVNGDNNVVPRIAEERLRRVGIQYVIEDIDRDTGEHAAIRRHREF